MSGPASVHDLVQAHRITAVIYAAAKLNLAEANGNQLRASVYMWDHQLYITEASAMPGSQAALQLHARPVSCGKAGFRCDRRLLANGSSWGSA